MHAKRLAIGLGAVAALALLTCVTGQASAGDTMRLSLPGSTTAPTLNLKATADDLDADTVATRFYGRGGFGGGFRGGFVGGFRGGYGGFRGGFVGVRGGFGGFRGVGFGRGFYGGRFVGGYFGPRYFGGYFGPRFYRPFFGRSVFWGAGLGGFPIYSGLYGSGFYGSSFCYPSLAYAWPCGSASITIGSLTTSVGPPTTIYSTPSYVTPGLSTPSYSTPGYTPPMPQADEVVPSQPGTYPYNGGPSQGVPMPPPEESAVSIPRLSKPAVVEDVLVSIPEKTTGKWKYPAYGEAPTRTGSR